MRIQRRDLYKYYKFTLEQLADFICEYTKDGKRTKKRDVLDWWKWFEKKCGVTTPYIRKFGGKK